MTTERKAIKAGNQLIHQTIYNQAGSIQKALLEYIMNSVDAGASQIKITLNENGIDYSIEDNGNGFGEKNYSTEEKKKCIDEVFGYLGFCHGTDDENYRVYGKFGIGRAQLWAFSKNNWHTHNMTMDVDIKNEGLSYEIKEVDDFVDGCLIVGQFYDRVLPNDIVLIKKDLSRLAAFAPIEVYFNNVKINKKMSDLKSNLKIENMHVSLQETSSLKVYNQGVFVREYSNHTFGVGGIICSEIGFPFELNAARNDILQSRCKMWKKLKTALDARLGRETKTKRLTDDVRKTILNKIASGQYYSDDNQDDFIKKPLLKMVNNRYISILKLLEGTSFAIAENAFDPVAESIHNEGVHKVLLESFTSELGVNTDDFLSILNDILHSYNSYKTIQVNFVDLNELKSKIDINHVPIPQNKLTKRQKLFLEAANLRGLHTSLLVNTYSYESGRYVDKQRKVLLGNSDTADAWTDGVSVIYINAKIVKEIDKNASTLMKIINLLVHEYCHDEDNTDMHSIEFYKKYHDMTIDNQSNLFAAFMALQKGYTSRLIKNDFVIPKKLNRSLNGSDLL